MIFTKIILHKCNRFYIKGKETIEVSPRDKLNLVLGRNGSGKSSLLEVGFNPVPPNTSDFRKGGFRKQWISNHAGDYILISDFKSGPSHEFWFNGENLNKGFTAGVQADLVKDHFGVTKDIMNLLTGNDQHRFTAMSPAVRGEWFAKMSSADFTFGLKLFNNMRKLARDTKANSQYQLSRLAKESEKLINEDDLKRLKDRSEQLSKELAAVSRLSRNNVSRDTLGSLQRHLEFFNKDITDLFAVSQRCVDKSIVDTESNNVFKQVLSEQITSLRTISSEVGKQLVEYEEELRKLEEIAGIDLDTLLGEISLVEDKISVLSNKLVDTKFKTNVSDIDVNRAIKEINEFLNVADSSTMLMRHKAMEPLQTREYDLVHLLNEHKSNLQLLEHQKESFESSTNVKCPSCTTVFNPLCDHIDIDAVNVTIETLINKTRQIEKELLSIRDEKDTVRSYIAQYDRLRSSLHVSDLPIWNYIRKIVEESFVDDVSTCDFMADLKELCWDFIEYLKDKGEVERLTHYLSPLITTKERVLNSVDKDRSIHDLLKTTTDRLTSVNTELSTKQTELSMVEANGRNYDRIVDMYDQAVSLEQEILKGISKEIEFIHQEEVELLIDGHTREITTVNNAIFSEETTRSLIEDIRNETTVLSDESRILTMILKELNPKDGLIADQMYLHIRKIISMLNGLIARVWSYPMVIRDCSNDNGELNYKFPVYLHVDTNERSDVSETSKSQKNIINTAFRIIAYNALGLSGIPLLLDEFDEGFDEEHRANMLILLDQLFSEGDFGQILIVSHFFHTYKGFSNKDYIVIDGEGMNIEGEIPNNVRIY